MRLNKDHVISVLVLLLLFAIAALASYHRWLYDYISSPVEYCPDGYCEYAMTFHTLFDERTPESFSVLHHEFRQFTHSSSMLEPMLIGFTLFFVNDVIHGYLLVSLLAGIGTILLLVYHLYQNQTRNFNQIWLVVPFLLFNFVFLRGFMRPITDAIGMFAVFAILILLERLTKRFSFKKAAYLGSIYFILLFSRISTLFIIPFIVLWNVYLYIKYRKTKYLEIIFLWGLGVPFIFLLTLLSLESAVSILRNSTQAVLPVFTVFHNLKWFIAMVLTGVHTLPIIWLSTTRKLFSETSYTMHIVWIFFYLSILILGGGAFWSRYMAPVIPSIVYVSAPGLIKLYKSNRYIFWGFCFVYVLSNLFALLVRSYFQPVVLFGKNLTELTY